MRTAGVLPRLKNTAAAAGNEAAPALRRLSIYLMSAVRRLAGIERSSAQGPARLPEALLNSDSLVMLLIDPLNGRIVDASRGAAGFYGYRLAELRAMSIFQINTLSRQEMGAALEAARLARSNHFAFRDRLADGTLRDVDVASALVEHEGRPVLLFIVTDLAQEKLLQASLRESEERYRRTVEHAAVGISEVDLSGRYLYVNDKLCEISGYSREELLQKTFLEITHPDDAEADLRQLERLKAGEMESFTMEKRYVRKDGRTHWIEINVSLQHDTQGEPSSIIAIVRSIHDRKLAEDALLESERNYRSIFEYSVHGLYRTDAQGLILSANPALVKMLGYESERELKSAHTDELFLFRENAAQIDQLLREKGEARDVVSIIRRKDGELLIVRDNTRVIYDERGEVLFFEGTLADITEEKRTVDSLSRRAAELEVLYENSVAMGLSLEPREIAQRIIEVIERKLNWHHVAIREYHPDDDRLEVLAFNMPGVAGPRVAEETDRLNQLISHPGDGLSGWVAKTGETVRTGSLQSDARYVDTYPGLQSGLYVPMKVGEKVIGSIAVESEMPEAFDADDERLLVTLAAQAAASIDNARLFGETQRRAAELGALSLVSSALRHASTRSQMMPVLLDEMLILLSAHGALIGLTDPSGQDVILELGRGSLSHLTGRTIPGGTELVTQALATQPSFAAADIRGVDLPLDLQDTGDVRAVAGVPLIAQDRVIGVLVAARNALPDGSLPEAFTEQEIHLFRAMGDMAANAFHRASLHEQTALHAEQMASVSHLGRLLGETTELDTLYKRLAESLQHILPDICALFISLYEPDIQLIRTVCAQYEGVFLDPAQMPPIPYSHKGTGHHSQVIATRQPLILKYIEANTQPAQPYPSFARAPKSALYVPMLTDGKVIGLILVQSLTPARFSSGDVEMLTLIANTAAVQIENTRLIAQYGRHVQRLTALHAMDTAINSSTDLRLSLRVVLEQAIHLLDVDAASVLLLNPVTLNLEFIAGSGFRVNKAVHPAVRLGEGLSGKVALQRAVIQSTNPADVAACFLPGNYIDKESFRAYIGVPLISKGKVSGVLQFFSRRPPETSQEWLDFMNVLSDQVALAVNNAHLFTGLERANVELTMAYDATIEGWSRALDLRDHETEGHTERVTDLTLQLAATLEIPDHQIPHIRRGALLHDIGKMGVPDDILRKPAGLSPEEWDIMRRHPQLAHDLLYPIAYLRPALHIPYSHHEKWDGTGYPQGLKGEEIPLSARLFAVVDVYDALISNRPYRPAWPREKALEHIREQAGKHFDPFIVEMFLRLMSQAD